MKEKDLFDMTLVKDLIEVLGKSLTFPEIDAMGNYFFKQYNTHKLENRPEHITISPLTAAKRLVYECRDNKKLKELFVFAIELDGASLNGKVISLTGLENLLYRFSRSGLYFDFTKRKIRPFNEDKKMLPNWAVLKDGKKYQICIASIDICSNSKLVKKHSTGRMEKVYYLLWEHLQNYSRTYDARIWSWAGDGGLIAFRNDKGPVPAVSCCLEILFTIPIFNASPHKFIKDDIQLRIGLDMGEIKFYSDTGRIVSDVINYAAHLEKKGTKPNGLSVSDTIYKALPPTLQKMFKTKKEFEGRDAHSLVYDFKCALK
ncbi:MAG: adenylate/guanylate cyclase domain-containing protein [Spirochaetales bacterium]|nr:adenylate/guanylate cyclase domain-containing protein [Spirochaetales bacterium]